MAIPVLVALLLGRVFCSWVCPISFISETADVIIRFVSRRKYRKSVMRLPRRIFWAALICELCLAMIAGVHIFVFLSPPGLVGREIMMAVLFKTLAFEGIIVIAVIILHLITPRFFCRYFCPLGALLGVIGSKRRLYVDFEIEDCVECGMCTRACPLGLDPSRAETLSAYCWNCGECVDSCVTDALQFRWKPVEVSRFSSKRIDSAVKK
jgi:ferredoxin-type protein NapH